RGFFLFKILTMEVHSKQPLPEGRGFIVGG
ncbi:MAG: hypothetical protein ACI86H_001496, partial [bacterium]